MHDPEILEALREYYESHVTHHTLDNGTRVAVTTEGRHDPEQPTEEGKEEGEQQELGKFQYVDEARNLIFSLDVNNGEVGLVDSSYTNPLPEV